MRNYLAQIFEDDDVTGEWHQRISKAATYLDANAEAMRAIDLLQNLNSQGYIPPKEVPGTAKKTSPKKLKNTSMSRVQGLENSQLGNHEC